MAASPAPAPAAAGGAGAAAPAAAGPAAARRAACACPGAMNQSVAEGKRNRGVSHVRARYPEGAAPPLALKDGAVHSVNSVHERREHLGFQPSIQK